MPSSLDPVPQPDRPGVVVKKSEQRSRECLLRWCVRAFKCDAARIISPLGTHFLILGWKKNTKAERKAGREKGQWVRNGDPVDFDYLEEKTVASGNTLLELAASARRYRRLLKMPRQTWLLHLLGGTSALEG